MAEKVPGYQRAVAPEGQPALDSNLGEGSAYGQLRQTLSRLAGKVGAMADKSAASEGERAGLMAGLDPFFRPGRSDSIYGQAYDRAETRAWLDGQQNILSEKMSQLSIQFEADPSGLAQAIAQLEAETVQGLQNGEFPEANVAFAGFFARARTINVREAILAKTDKDKANWLAIANAANERRNNELDRITYAGGLDDEAQKTAAGIVEDERRANEALVDAGVITPEQARQRDLEADKRVKLGPFIGAFDQKKTIAEKQRMLADFDEQYKANSGGLADIVSGDDAEKLRNYMKQQINNAEADQRAEVSDIARRAKDLSDMAEKGFVPRGTDLDTLDQAASATGNENAMAIAQAARARAELADRFVKMGAWELEATRRGLVEQMSKGGATPAQVETLAQIDRVKSAREDQLSADPYSWGVRAGKIEAVPALSIGGSPEVFAGTLQARRTARNRLRQSYGNVPFFTKAEKEVLAEVARQGGQAAMGVASTLVQSLGAEDATTALGEIAEDVPVLANVGGLLANGGSAAVAQDAMDAISQRKLKDLPKVKMSDAARTVTARGKLGGAYILNGRSEAAVIGTAELAAEKRLRAMGIEGDVSSDSQALEVFEQALDEAAGGTVRGGVAYGGIDEVNGSKIVAPPNVRKGEVEGRLHRVTDLSKLPPIGSGNGVAITPRQIQGATLVTVGNGRYRAALGDPRTPDARYVKRPDGTNWEISVEDLRKAAPDPEIEASPQLLFDALGNPLQ